MICTPTQRAYWHLLSSTVAIIDADTGSEDSLKYRLGYREWVALHNGFTHQEARNLIMKPPKSPGHKHYQIYKDIMEYPGLAPATLPNDLVVIGNTTNSVEPFTYNLFDGNVLPPLMPPLGIDVETDVEGGHPNETTDRLMGVGIAQADGRCVYGSWEDETFREWLIREAPQWEWVGHNSKYDLAVLKRHGVYPGPLIGDGMLAAYLMGEPEAALKKLVQNKYSYRMLTYDEVARGRSMSDVPIEEAAPYCCADAYWGLKVALDLEAELRKANPRAHQLYVALDLPLINVLVNMELRGISIDREGVETQLTENLTNMDTLAETITLLAAKDGFVIPSLFSRCDTCHGGKVKRLTCEACGGIGKFETLSPINPNSSQQLKAWFHDKLGFPVQSVSLKTRQPSLDESALLHLRHRHIAIDLILAYRKLDKEVGFLVQWIAASEQDGRVHSVINNARVRSGRFSYRDPNLQQVTLELRRFFRGGLV